MTPKPGSGTQDKISEVVTHNANLEQSIKCQGQYSDSTVIFINKNIWACKH